MKSIVAHIVLIFASIFFIVTIVFIANSSFSLLHIALIALGFYGFAKGMNFFYDPDEELPLLPKTNTKQ